MAVIAVSAEKEYIDIHEKEKRRAYVIFQIFKLGENSFESSVCV